MFSYKNPKYRIDIVFSNKQYGGVYALGPLIVYNTVNNRKDWYCERVFLDKGKVTAPLVGFTLQYEPDLEKALAMKPKEGITFAGGPVVHTYTEEVAKHFDFVILGDVEAVLDKILDLYEEGNIEKVEDLPGVYVKGGKKSFASIDLDEVAYPLVQPFPDNVSKDYVFGKCFMLEIERGCPYNCSFCAIPAFYNGKVKFRSLEKIKKIIDEGLKVNNVDKVVIYAPSFVHPKRNEILKYLISKKVRVTVPSVKADSMSEETLKLIHEAGQESLTIAPECGEQLRFELNKKVKDEEYFNFVERCNKDGIRKLKLYLLIGLPGMSEKDLEEMIAFVNEMKERFDGELYLSVNPLVPKKCTKFENIVYDKKNVKKQAQFLKKKIRNCRLKNSPLSQSHKEATILEK